MVETRAGAKLKRANEESEGEVEKTNSTTKSRLLDLAPELRNRIYEYALLEPGHCNITKDFQPPGLLSTCRQIRGEALPMFYQQNEFSHDIVDCDGSLFLTWSRYFVELLDKEEVNFRFSGRPNWSNLVSWVEGGFNSKAMKERFEIEEDDLPWQRVIFTALEIGFQGKQGGLIWDEVATQLEYLHQTVAAYDPAWK